MEYRTLGKTGLKVSALSFGASSLGGVFRDVQHDEALRAVHVSLDLGINFIDVSPYYALTKAETVLGAALKGIAYTKSHREEVLALLKQFAGLPDIEMSRKTFDVIKELWPDNGIPSNTGLATALSMADVPAIVPADRIVDWAPVSEAAVSLKIR